MAYDKILEACNEALAHKDYALDMYRDTNAKLTAENARLEQENETLSKKVAEMGAFLQELKGGMN